QAEDGIRDFHVTGVQTCALPICDETIKETIHNVFRGYIGLLSEFDFRLNDFVDACIFTGYKFHGFTNVDAFIRTFPRKYQKYMRSEEHTSELQSRENLVCRLLLE